MPRTTSTLPTPKAQTYLDARSAFERARRSATIIGHLGVFTPFRPIDGRESPLQSIHDAIACHAFAVAETQPRDDFDIARGMLWGVILAASFAQRDPSWSKAQREAWLVAAWDLADAAVARAEERLA